MPDTLTGSTLAVLVLAVLLAVTVLVTRTWGAETAADPLVVLWRRIRARAPRPDDEVLLAEAEEGGDEDGGKRRWFRRRREGAEEPVELRGASAPEPVQEEEPVFETVRAPDPPPAPSRRPGLDHVPFGEEAASVGDGDDEGRFRDRFRVAMRKTRDYLNRDVREVFGPGPIPETFEALEEVLVRADVGVPTATALSDELRERGRELTSDTLPLAFKDVMRSFLQDADRRLRVNLEGPSIWLIVGVNGTGKTTSIAKLAAHAKAQGFSVCLAAADTFRAAAIEQLETWGERVGVEVVRQHPGADPGAVVFDAIERSKARGYDLLLVDTAGRLHTRKPLMEELRKVRRVIDRDPALLTETLLVLDATTGQNGIAQARAFQEAVDVTGLVLAKLDGTAKGGITFAVERELGIPVKVVGTGERLGDVEAFDPDAFVDAIFDAEPA
jgi:fused signal recognition particle receptor